MDKPFGPRIQWKERYHFIGYQVKENEAKLVQCK